MRWHRFIITTSGHLRPPVLTPFGLEKAILSHASTFESQHTDLKLHLDLAQDGQILTDDVRLVLFRIYQELLGNIVRHTGARDIWIRPALSATEVEMAREGHLGLVGVQERAGSVGGYVTFLSKRGEGTTVRITIPLEYKRLGD